MTKLSTLPTDLGRGFKLAMSLDGGVKKSGLICSLRIMEEFDSNKYGPALVERACEGLFAEGFKHIFIIPSQLVCVADNFEIKNLVSFLKGYGFVVREIEDFLYVSKGAFQNA